MARLCKSCENPLSKMEQEVCSYCVEQLRIESRIDNMLSGLMEELGAVKALQMVLDSLGRKTVGHALKLFTKEEIEEGKREVEHWTKLILAMTHCKTLIDKA